MRAIDRLLRNRPKAGGLSLAGKIKALFANGEQGWWYDPSNFSTLFQDAAGTTPVTAVEQPVGLQLDLSKGLVLGPELVTNGDFSNGTTGWTPSSSTLSVSDGKLVVTAAGVSSRASQAVTTVANTWYEAQFTFGGGTAVESVRIGVSIDNAVYYQTTVDGSYKIKFLATTATTYITLKAGDVIGLTAIFDNISVKELPGNHRFQSTSANRPVVSARVNLLTKTEEFNDAAWTKTNVTVTANAIVAPDGTLTADKVEATASASTEMRQDATVLATEIIATARIKKGSGANDMNRFQIRSITAGATLLAIAVNLDNGVITYVNGSTGATVTAGADGWFVVRMVVPITSGHTIRFSLGSNGSNETAGEFSYIWGADLRPTNQGVGLPAYQRVNTSTDYDSTGFPVYIKPNGSNQFMQTNSINFTATDKMTVWQGVRKLSDAQSAVLLELGVGGASGGFSVFAPITPDRYTWLGNGNIYSFATQAAGTRSSIYTAPNTSVITGLGNISGDLNTLRINGAQVSQATGDQGAGNYGNFPAYFYMRTGTTVPFNGHDYGSIARGAASTAAQITAGEAYINSKTRAFA
jgi:hypothetical protein